MKSVDAKLGIRTWGFRMDGSYESFGASGLLIMSHKFSLKACNPFMRQHNEVTEHKFYSIGSTLAG